jgi:hypothetical protein
MRIDLRPGEALACAIPEGVYAFQTGEAWRLPQDATLYLLPVPQHLLVIAVYAPDEAGRRAILDSMAFSTVLPLIR